jgi:hypothetical protein
MSQIDKLAKKLGLSPASTRVLIRRAIKGVDIPLSLVLNRIEHARKRRKTDVVLGPDADKWWSGYIAALVELTDWSDAQQAIAELKKGRLP